MLAWGETYDEVINTMHLRNHHVDILTLGRYLQPTKSHSVPSVSLISLIYIKKLV